MTDGSPSASRAPPPDARPLSRQPRVLAPLVLAAVLLLAGCAAPLSDAGRPDPAGDRIGWEGGYWYDDPVDVDATDGLNESEHEALVARMMARLEHIRSLEFERTVEVSIINRTEYLRDRANGSSDNVTTHERWNDQVWEGLFLVGEGGSFSAAANQTYGAAVQGFYAPARGEIVIVSERPRPVLRRGTLVHELVHALQDQQFGLGYPARTQDQQLAGQGVIEGEANALEARYQKRCGGAWRCFEPPTEEGAGGGGGGRPHPGVLLVVLNPYASGPGLVEAIHDRGGWPAVNDLYERFPDSTEQVIHPAGYPDETPVPVTVENRSRGGWERFDHDPVADTVGEASIFAMLFENAATEPGRYRYSYDDPASAGWGGDALVPYRNGEEYGYVWKTVWDSERDARQFLRAYHEVLAGHGGTMRDAERGIWVVPDSDPFGDAFRVLRRGDTVLVVNGPTRAALDRIHPPA